MSRFLIFSIIILVLYNCNSPSYNRKQYHITKQFFDCYKVVFDSLTKDEKKWKKLTTIRDNSSELEDENKYKLIREEYYKMLPLHWQNDCLPILRKNNSLQGIIIPEKETMIIKINEFERHSMRQQYSKNRLFETHRLIRQNYHILPSNYNMFNIYPQRVVHEELISDKWIYLITQHELSY